MANNLGLQQLSITSLKLDQENPRLPLRLKNSPEKEVLEWMLTDATLTDLMGSIVENGFFGGEALIGIEDKKHPNSFIIVEGNRRLAAIKLLATDSEVSYKAKTVKELHDKIIENGKLPTHLPVFVVTSRQEVQNYLGYRHVTGVKQWPVIAKARYLNHLFAEFTSNGYNPDVYSQLAREIGSKSNYVRRLIIGYKLFQKISDRNFYDLDYINEDNLDLSRINDAAVMYSNIEEYMGVNKSAPNPILNLKEEEFENVFRWLYEKDADDETRIGDSRNLPILNKILGTPLAREKFIDEKVSLNEAAEFTDLVNDYLRNYLSVARVNMAEAQGLMHRVVFPTSAEINMVQEIKQRAEAIQNTLLLNRSKNSAE